MELSSSGTPDKLNNLNKSDLSPQRDKDEVSAVKTEPCDIHEPMSQRCVIIHKDEKGYGLTVSGDNPVFVQSVKDDGAAARAGVQQGDRIIKVNGTLVTQSNHQDVVELIKSGSFVALTLLGKKPLGHARTMSGTLQPLNISGTNTCGSHTIPSGRLSSPSERITGPQPVDSEKQQQLTNSRIYTIRKMLEKEVIYLENLRSEYSKSTSEKVHAEMNGAIKRVKTLEEQLHALTGITHEQIIPKSPKSPPASHLRHYHSEKENRHSVISPTGCRPLTHQISAPALPPKPDHLQFSHAKANNSTADSKSPVSSKRNSYQNSQLASPPTTKASIYSSFENIDNQINCRTTTWPQVHPSHARQCSSPESIIKGLRHHKNAKMTASDSLYRSHSEASHHFHKSPVSETLSSEVTNSHKTGPSKDTSLESSAESPIPSPTHSPSEYAEIQGDSLEAPEADEPSHEEYGTPPESTGVEVNMQSVITKLGQNPSIICMEDDDFSSDTELGHLEDHGPYNGLWKLVRHPAHLAVFMHYLMSNSNSSSLFFYLISEMYEQGNVREMKKWAYEIHSSFLVPGAPMKVATVDEAILHEIDGVLLNHIDKEDTLRSVFKKARKKAKEELNDLLADFRNKRTMGLANIFSPPDYQLDEAGQNKNKEISIIEQLLLPYLENIPEDFETMNDDLASRTCALATILKNLCSKSTSQVINTIDRCPTFVSKDKTRLRFLQRNKKMVQAQDHQFLPQHYYSVTYCNHCQLIIWGVGSQGYQCHNCEMNIHKTCVKVVEERCIGALRNKKDKKKDRMSGLMENIIGKTRKPSHPVPAAIERAKKLNEEMNSENDASHTNDSGQNENCHDSSGRNENKDHPKLFNDGSYSLHLQNDLDRIHFNKKNAGIGRSESFRQRRESRPSFRKRSDPNIPRSKSDVEVDDKSASNLNNSGSSSNSSLSNRSWDSPSASSDMVHRTPVTATDSFPPCSTATSTTPNVPSPLTNTPSTTSNHYDDSDLDAETDPPNWQENVDWEVLRLMKPKEKKRQDVINELFHTERTHVRNLKVLDRIFYRPLLQEQLLPTEFVHFLFPNLEEVVDIHSSFNNKMKTRRKEEATVGDIGDMMLEMFDGEAGEHLKRAAATCCQNHSIALESLKLRQKKDQKLAQFLSDAELHNLCRRLQLKDIIASGFQRITKYPLLLENIAKYTPPNTPELSSLQRCVECSKDILVYVNTAVKEAVNLHRLSDIQKRLEKTAFDKVEHIIVQSFKNLDVTKHKLVHEGQLTWRLNKQKTVDMHVVLLEDILVLLQKQDEKYILKFHNTNLTSGRADTIIMHSPILYVQNLLIRNNATDERSIFLISSSELHAMYEFVAATASEKKRWCRHLTEAVEEVKKSTIGHPVKPQEISSLVPDHPVPSEALASEDSSNKESQGKETTRKSTIAEDSLENVNSQPPSTETNNLTSDTPSCDAPTPVPTSPEENGLGAATAPPAQPKPQKRLQRVEILKISDGPQLIEPSEVIVSQGAILQTAEPVLTPIEKLRRKDQEIATAIHEKEKLVEDIMQLPAESIAQSNELDEENESKSAQELAVSAVYQANQLSLLLSECLNVADDFTLMHGAEDSVEENSDASPSEGEQPPVLSRKVLKVPIASTDKLLNVSMSLNKKLTQLLAAINEVEDERVQLRKELMSTKDQVHLMHEAHRNCTVRSQSPSNHSHSRPNSFVSVTSSISEDMLEVPDEMLLTSVLNRVIEESDATDSASETNAPSSSPTGNQPGLSLDNKQETNDQTTTTTDSQEDNSCAVETNLASNCDQQISESHQTGTATTMSSSSDCTAVSDSTPSDTGCSSTTDTVDS